MKLINTALILAIFITMNIICFKITKINDSLDIAVSDIIQRIDSVRVVLTSKKDEVKYKELMEQIDSFEGVK